MLKHFFPSRFLFLFLFSIPAVNAQDYSAQVQEMYVAYYSRPGDPAGVDFWVSKLAQSSGNLTAIIDQFGNSTEYNDRFLGQSDSELINNIYLNLFGRDTDSGGMEFYLDRLQSGAMTLVTIALNISDGVVDGTDDAVIVNNKLVLAAAYTAEVAAQEAEYGGEQIAAAVELVASVNSSQSSLDSALDSLAELVAPAADNQIDFDANPNLSGQFRDAVLVNRNPDCRAYATDTNEGDYNSSQITDISSGISESVSLVEIQMVIASNWNASIYDYENVQTTTDVSLATHCRMVSNMVPNHTFGVEVTGPNGDGWINAIDHSDTEITYIPVNPVKTNTPTDTPRNPPIYDFDGILLNGVGIAMDSGFCYQPGVVSGPLSLRSNAAGNASGCGPQNTWFELPAYTIWDQNAENMAAVFDDYFGHGFVATYHYHALTHPLQEDNDQTHPPSNGQPSPVIGFAADGFPIYGHWLENENGELVKAESGYETYSENSRTPIPTALHGTPPTPWDIANNPEGFDSDFGLDMGRYEQDWFFSGTGNLDQCNGTYDRDGNYGYYITDKYPFAPPCVFGARDPSFGKISPSLP